jgi:imidazolonepropionase-like amidohydrolase
LNFDGRGKPPLHIRGATIIDGVGGRPYLGELLVDDGRFLFVGPGEAPAPPHAIVIDAQGKFVIPGLMDANVHLIWDIWPKTLITFEGRYDDVAIEVAQIALRSGITTVFDTWGPRDYLIRARDRIESGEAVAARLRLAGNILGFDGPFSADFLPQYREAVTPSFADRINAIWQESVGRRLMWMTPEQVRAEVRAYFQQGIDFAKVAFTGHLMDQMEFMQFSPRVQRVIVEEARRANLPIQTHTTNVEGVFAAADLGVDLMQHPDTTGASVTIPEETIALVAERKIACALQARTERANACARHRAEIDPYFHFYDVADLNSRNLIAGGATIVLATDSGCAANDTKSGVHWKNMPQEENLLELGEGHFHWLKAVEQLGMTPMDILQAATINVARAYHLDDRLGTLEEGKIADLLILDKNPLADASHYRSIDMIMKEGRIVDRERLPSTRLLTA